MAKKKDPQVDPGGKAGQDGQGEGAGEGAGGAGDGEGGGGGAGSGGNGEGGSGGGEGGGKEGEGTQYVTPSALQGVMGAHKRTTEAAQKKSDDKIDALTSTIEGLTERLAGNKEGDGGGKVDGEGAGGKKIDPEVAELRRRLDQAEANLETEKTSRAAAEQKEEDGRFERTVKDALNAAGCEKTDAAFLVIKPLLLKRDDGTPFATVKLDGGLETDMDLKTFVEREFSENVLPHVFKGKMRTGSPASGDDGSGEGGGGFDYTWDQVQDPKFYADNIEKVRKAIELGRVKGMPKQATGAV